MGMFLSLATSPKVRRLAKASIAALALFKGLLEPNCFAKIFFTPASSSTVRTAPPAITPVPGAAGRMNTFAPPDTPLAICTMEFALVRETSTNCFLASATPLRTAPMTSAALPTPTPTCPFSLPTTTMARKLSFLPPFTTLLTRRICTTRSCQAESLSLARPFLRDLLDLAIVIIPDILI